MSNRVSDSEVRLIIPDTSITNLTPFITAANKVVDRMAASDCGSDLSDIELVEVETWLSAHYAAVSDPILAVKSIKFENSANEFSRGASSSMNGVMSTQYGQMANTLSDGCLIESDMRKTSFFSIGGDTGGECESV